MEYGELPADYQGCYCPTFFGFNIRRSIGMKETIEKLKELSTQMREQAALSLTVHNQVEREIAVLEGAENSGATNWQ